MAEEAPPSPEVSNFDQDRVTDLLLKLVIKGNLPFHMVEIDEFTTFSQELQPEYERVSKTTLLDRAFKHYLQAKKDLIEYFENYQSKVSLTLYPWKTTGGYDVRYTCITCHWIDRETWKMSKRIISLEQFEDVDEVILLGTSELNLKGKVMSLGFDDSDGFYTNPMERLKTEVNPMLNGVLFHSKCVCHVLNSMVKSSLDHVDPIITKFEILFKYIYWTHENEYKTFVRAKGAKFPYMLRNLPHKWNTTYTMLRRMVKQKLLIVEYYASCDDKDIDIDDNDWQIIESLLGILKVFHTSILRLSDVYHPTAPLVLGEILLISHMFKDYKQSVLWESVILEMQSKLLKYYETMPEVFTCAAALNPKIGIGGVENILEDIEEYLGLHGYATTSMTKCSDALRQVFDYYDKMHRSRGRKRKESDSSNILIESVSGKDSRTGTIATELELYTKTTDFQNVMNRDEYENFNVLEWWKNKGRHQYPVLAEMAGDILTIQASSMPFEFAFCLNGRVLDEPTTYKMSQLESPKLDEIRIFLKEDFDSNDSKQNVTLVDDDDESEYDESEDDEGEDDEMEDDESEDVDLHSEISNEEMN